MKKVELKLLEVYLEQLVSAHFDLTMSMNELFTLYLGGSTVQGKLVNRELLMNLMETLRDSLAKFHSCYLKIMKQVDPQNN